MGAPLDGPRAGSAKPRQLVVLLHGFGADGRDLVSLGRQWAELLPDAAIVAPNAPEPCPGSPGGGALSWGEFRGGAVRVEQRATPAVWGDAVLSRRDIATSYHVAVVADDASQGITDVVRGEDLFMATHLHRLLQVLLELPAPEYHHHPVLRDGAGQKLSKSLRAKSLRAFRQDGVSREAMLARIGLPQFAAGSQAALAKR